MKLKSLILSTALIATPWIAGAQDGKKADLQDVTRNLDMDGQFFMASNIEGDLSKLAALGNDFAKTAKENGNKCFQQDLNFEAILTDMGMDLLTAYGRSAKHEGDHWVNKMYVQNNGSKKGVFSLSGKGNSNYEVINFAPSGTDLVMEWNVDTRQLMASTKSIPKCERSKKFLSRKLPAGGTMEDMLNKFKAKVSIAVKLDDDKREACPFHKELTFPKIHACMRMEGANQIWDQAGKMAGFMMKIEKQDDGTLLMTPRKQRKGRATVVLMDTENDRLWVATSPEFLTECRGDGAKLSADADFKSISDGVTKGSALAYISRQACLEIRQVKEAKFKKKDKKCLSDDMIKRIMDHLTESKNGYFAEMHKSKKGINFVLKAPCPVKEILCLKCGGRNKCGAKNKCGSSCKKSCKKKSCEKKKCEKKKCEKTSCDKKSCDKKSCDKDGASCKKGNDSCAKSDCSKSSKSKDACACEKGKCKCSKDKSACKCEDTCKCAKPKTDLAPKVTKAAEVPEKKAEGRKSKKKKNKKNAPKPAAPEKEATPATKAAPKAVVKPVAKPVPAKDFTPGGDMGDM